MVHTENIDALLQRVALDLIDDYDMLRMNRG